MKDIAMNEARSVEGGYKTTYWYTNSGVCSYYVKCTSYLKEPWAAMKVKAHSAFCSLCVGKKLNCSYSKPYWV